MLFIKHAFWQLYPPDYFICLSSYTVTIGSFEHGTRVSDFQQRLIQGLNSQLPGKLLCFKQCFMQRGRVSLGLRKRKVSINWYEISRKHGKMNEKTILRGINCSAKNSKKVTGRKSDRTTVETSTITIMMLMLVKCKTFNHDNFAPKKFIKITRKVKKK